MVQLADERARIVRELALHRTRLADLTSANANQPDTIDIKIRRLEIENRELWLAQNDHCPGDSQGDDA